MAKKTTLLEQVMTESPVPTGAVPWYESYAKSNAEKMKQIDELIDAWSDGKCPGWSKSQIARRLIAFGVPVKETAIERYINQRREARNAKATD